MNCSHGSAKIRSATLRRIRRIEKKLGKPIGIMIDLQGPKLRVGDIDGSLSLKEDEVWKLTYWEQADQEKKVIPLGFSGLPKAITKGGRIYIDDGLIRTEVIRKNKEAVWVRVLTGGPLYARKGLNIPNYKGKLPVLSPKDKEDLIWGVKNKADFVALSFVRSPNDIILLKKLIQKHTKEYKPLVIAKIEKPEAVERMDKIIQVSDGILVARGDLGIELSLAKVPVVQKQLIEKCRYYKKPVIVATQMLDSMRTYPIPTRAEVSDVASSIYAGADSVLLTGETSSGKYPVKAVSMMQKIILEVENHMIQKTFRKTKSDFGLSNVPEAFMFNVIQLADDINAKAIVMLTRQGRLTKIISKLHPKQPVFTLANNHFSYREMTLFWGVYPIEIKALVVDKRIDQGMKLLKQGKVIKKSDNLIFVYWDYKSENLNLKVVQC